jgi:hypothetical protein
MRLSPASSAAALKLVNERVTPGSAGEVTEKRSSYGEADGGHRPPEPVRVLGVVEGDRGVGEAQVQRGEEPRGRR